VNHRISTYYLYIFARERTFRGERNEIIFFHDGICVIAARVSSVIKSTIVATSDWFVLNFGGKEFLTESNHATKDAYNTEDLYIHMKK